MLGQYGSKQPGIAVLEELCADAHQRGLLVLLDAKRGDIGSTMDAYAEAFLRDGSPLAGDALTVTPYLGFGSLSPAVDLALSSGRGLFVLCLTSNKEGHEVQHARTPVDGAAQDRGEVGASVAATMAAHAAALNADADPLGSIGLVVGATVGDAAARTGTDLKAVNGPLLAPGVGAQGAGAKELAAVFGDARRQVLASSSRGVLRTGPDVASLRRAADEAGAEARAALRG